MGLDTECDAAIEARGDERVARGDPRVPQRAARRASRRVARKRWRRAVKRGGGSRAGAIEALTSDERSLRHYERLDELSETLVAVAGSVADPEQPVSLDTLIAQFAPERRRARRARRWVMPVVVLAIGCAAHGAVALHAAGRLDRCRSRDRMGRRVSRKCGGRRCSCCSRTRPRASCCFRGRSSRCSPSRRSAPGTASPTRSAASCSPRLATYCGGREAGSPGRAADRARHGSTA